MTRFALSLALVAGLTAAMWSTSNAQQKEGEKKRPTETPAQKAVSNLGLADQLIDYGTANDEPGALITAALILNKNDVKNDTKFKDVFKEEGYHKPEEIDGQERTAKTVLAMAKKMIKAKKLKGYEGQLAQATKEVNSGERSPYPGGCFVRRGHLHQGERATYYVHCHGHTHANVYPHYPNNNVDMDIFVYDSHGHLIRYDRSLAPSAQVHFDGDGDFRIVVHLYRGAHCDYTLRVS